MLGHTLKSSKPDRTHAPTSISSPEEPTSIKPLSAPYGPPSITVRSLISARFKVGIVTGGQSRDILLSISLRNFLGGSALAGIGYTLALVTHGIAW